MPGIFGHIKSDKITHSRNIIDIEQNISRI